MRIRKKPTCSSLGTRNTATTSSAHLFPIKAASLQLPTQNGGFPPCEGKPWHPHPPLRSSIISCKSAPSVSNSSSSYSSTAAAPLTRPNRGVQTDLSCSEAIARGSCHAQHRSIILQQQHVKLDQDVVLHSIRAQNQSRVLDADDRDFVANLISSLKGLRRSRFGLQPRHEDAVIINNYSSPPLHGNERQQLHYVMSEANDAQELENEANGSAYAKNSEDCINARTKFHEYKPCSSTEQNTNGLASQTAALLRRKQEQLQRRNSLICTHSAVGDGQHVGVCSEGAGHAICKRKRKCRSIHEILQQPLVVGSLPLADVGAGGNADVTACTEEKDIHVDSLQQRGMWPVGVQECTLNTDPVEWR